MNQKKSISKDLFYGTTVFLLTKFSSMIFILIIANLFTDIGLGAYSLFMAIIITASSFCELGIMSALTIYYPKIKNNIQKLALLKWSIKIRLTLTLIISSILILFKNELVNLFKIPQIIEEVYYIIILFLILQTFFDTIINIYYLQRKNNKVFQFFSIQTILKIFSIILIYSLTNSIQSMFYGLVMGSLITNLFLLYNQKNIIHGILNTTDSLKKTHINEIKKIWKTLFIQTIISPIFYSINYILINLFNPNLFLLGTYQLAIGLHSTLTSIIGLGNGIQVGVSETDKMHYEKLLKKILKFNYILVFPILILTNIIIGDIINLFFPKYIPTIELIKFLSISFIFVPITTLYPIFFNAIKKPEINTKIMLISATTLIITYLIFIPLFGTIGAVYCYLINTIITSCINIVYAFKEKLIIPNLKEVMFLGILSLIIITPFLFSSIPWYLSTIIGIIFYSVLIIITKIIKINELKEVLRKIICRDSI